MTGDRVVVGRVMKAHGIRGEVSIDVLSDIPERFAPGATVELDDRELTVESARPHQGRLLVKFEQVADRTAAEALRGAELTIGEERLAPLGQWSYYPHQLEGLRVVDEKGADLGTFAEALEGPANDIWVVRTARGEVMVPAVRAVVVSVDLDAGVIMLSPPEGLF